MTPKQMVLRVAPKATCARSYVQGGFVISFGCDVKDFNGQTIQKLWVNTYNPADAWDNAAQELRLK